MELKKGRRVILQGNWRIVRNIIPHLSVEFFHQGEKVLIIDTANSLNPHHSAYNNANQAQYFMNIYCARTPLPYDLWARLKTASSFIKRNEISVLIITSLSLIFRESSTSHEIKPLIQNILEQVDFLTQKYNLITLVANSPSDNNKAMKASALLSKESHVVEIG